MKEQELNPSESLAIINGMINNAKNKLADDGFLIIFWGWLVFTSAIINYSGILLGIQDSYFVWAILMPLGGVFSVVYGLRNKKTEKVKTYTESYLGYSWTAFIIALFITLAFMPVHGIQITYFFLMILYGIAIFISGGILNFRPLIIGSLFSFAFAIISAFTGEKEQFLCLAGALLFSYIIPGHLLRSKFKSQNV